jgi:hypothetical protein
VVPGLMERECHDGCRIEEFRRWTRVMLEHEREHLSRVTGLQAALLSDRQQAGIMHDIGDIDACLAATDEPLRVQASLQEETMVKAKVRCIGNSKPQYYPDDSEDTARLVRFTPVYDADPQSPNYEWSQATPSGYIELFVSNPDAFDKFQVGVEYMLMFEVVPVL